jgi:hypothetical protein
LEFRQFKAADFARLSRSMQLTLLIIHRAQLSSRKAVASIEKWKRPWRENI